MEPLQTNEENFSAEQSYSPFSETEYAGTGQRFLNYIIDVIVFYVCVFGIGTIFAIGYVASGNTIDDNYGEGYDPQLMLVSILFFIVYYTFMEGAMNGRTIGKFITGTKAVRDDDTDISWKDAFIRTLCRLIPFEPFSALGGSPWHDKWSNTKVIKTR